MAWVESTGPGHKHHQPHAIPARKTSNGQDEVDLSIRMTIRGERTTEYVLNLESDTLFRDIPNMDMPILDFIPPLSLQSRDNGYRSSVLVKLDICHPCPPWLFIIIIMRVLRSNDNSEEDQNQIEDVFRERKGISLLLLNRQRK